MEGHSSSNGMICADRHAIVCLPLVLRHVIEIMFMICSTALRVHRPCLFLKAQRAAGEGESMSDERGHERSDERPGLQRP
jgi:hypothetical protein